jgi:hypothetical protein
MKVGTATAVLLCLSLQLLPLVADAARRGRKLAAGSSARAGGGDQPTVTELLAAAKAGGATDAELDDAMDSEHPKQALRDLMGGGGRGGGGGGDAVGEYERAVARAPGDPQALAGLGPALQVAQRTAEAHAEHHLRRAVAVEKYLIVTPVRGELKKIEHVDYRYLGSIFRGPSLG